MGHELAHISASDLGEVGHAAVLLLGQAGGGGGLMQTLLMFGLMFGVFYFLLIRPQQKRQREHMNMLSSLQPGDVVVTRGGVLGKVTGVADSVVTLEVQEKVRVRVLKSYIDGKHAEPKTATGAPAPAKSKSAASPEAKN